MRAAVIVFPGINRENDMARALQDGAGRQCNEGLAHRNQSTCRDLT